MSLFDKNAAMYIIAGLMKEPTIIMNEAYKLTTEDFDDPLYRTIFAAIYNLALEGATRITPQDLDLYLSQYTVQYEKYKKQKGYDFLLSIEPYIDTIDEPKFSFYYNRVRKFTILRDLKKSGIDIKEFYNPDADFLQIENENEKLNKTTIEEMMRKLKTKISNIENKFVSKTSNTSQSAAKGIKELYFQLKKVPEIGDPIEGEILNYILRGARFGKLYLNSAPSGHGKTRFMVGNACALSLPRIETLDGKEVVVYREDMRPVLFVTTEQQADEIQTLLLAYVSGVNEQKILYGTCNPEEEKKVLLAAELIEEYTDNFIIEVIPDPSIALVKAKLINHILNNNIHYIFYDYIFSSPGLLSEFRDLRIREDVALMMLANTLKEIAANYNVFIQSGTQLNDKWETLKFRNQNSIRGSKAIADKADVGMVSIKLTEIPNELEQIRMMLETAGYKEDEMPNIVTDIYKNRRGAYTGIKLYRKFDYGTCRVKDVVLTTATHNIINDYGIVSYETRTKDLLDLMTEKRVDTK